MTEKRNTRKKIIKPRKILKITNKKKINAPKNTNSYIKYKLNSNNYIIEYANYLDKEKIKIIQQIFEKYYKKYIGYKSKQLSVGGLWTDIKSFDLFIDTFNKNKTVSPEKYKSYIANDNYIYNSFNYDLGRIFLFLLKQPLIYLKKFNKSLTYLQIDKEINDNITNKIKEYKVKNFLVGSTNLVLLKYVKLLDSDKVKFIKNILAVLKNKYVLYTELESSLVEDYTLYMMFIKKYRLSKSKFITKYSSQININFNSILLALFSMSKEQLLDILEYVKVGLEKMKDRVNIKKS